MSKNVSSPKNLTILTAAIAFKRDGETNFVDLGEAPSLSWTPNVTTSEYKTSRGAIRSTIREEITEQAADIAITLNEITARNLALAMLGTEADFTQDAAVAATKTIVGGAVAGTVHDIGVTDLVAESVSITDGTAVDPIAYTEGTHYTVDYDAGVISVVAIPATADADLKITYSTAAVTAADFRSIVDAFTSTAVAGEFMVVGKNAVGRKFKGSFKASLRPSGAVNFISEDWASLELAGKSTYDSLHPDYPFGRWTELKGEAYA
jgi:hypothetical protein